MKIPIRDLRDAIRDPREYLRERSSASANIRTTKFGDFRNAVFTYHKGGGDLQKAQDYLENKFELHFKNLTDLPEYLKKLQTYVREFKKLGTDVIKTRDNVRLTLPKDFDEFVLSGQVPRLDLTKDGQYQLWLFVRNDPLWKNDIRLPLLQDAYATKLDVPPDEITVGVYDFVLGQYGSTQFAPRDITRSRTKLTSFLKAIRELTRR